MANPTRKAIFRANIDDVITDIFPKTSADNVTINSEGKLLYELISELVTQDILNSEIESLRGDVPESFNSLKKLYDYIQSLDGGGSSADLSSVWEAINKKADLNTVTEIQENLQEVTNVVSHVCSLYFTQSLPETLTASDLWIQPVRDATVLEDLRQ